MLTRSKRAFQLSAFQECIPDGNPVEQQSPHPERQPVFMRGKNAP